jgi:lambda repressor-like predicted transcriptional regulator
MPAYMRNTDTGRIYVYDPVVYKRRKRVLEIIYGTFVDGKFVPEKVPPADPVGLPEEEEAAISEPQNEIEEIPPVGADESVEDPAEKMRQDSAEGQEAEVITPEYLKAELKNRGISGRNFAQKLGCSQSYLSKMLRGVKPIPEHIAIKSQGLLTARD